MDITKISIIGIIILGILFLGIVIGETFKDIYAPKNLQIQQIDDYCTDKNQSAFCRGFSQGYDWCVKQIELQQAINQFKEAPFK